MSSIAALRAWQTLWQTEGGGKGADLLIALDFNLEIDENFVVNDSFSQNSLVQNERMCNFAPAIETESHEIILITI